MPKLWPAFSEAPFEYSLHGCDVVHLDAGAREPGRLRCRRTKYKTREAAKTGIFDYIERFYNRKRTHAYLDYLTPVQYENQAVGT